MSIVRFQMFQDVGGGTPPPSTVSFTYTGPTAIDADTINSYKVLVSGLSGTYTAGKLLSIEFNIDYPDMNDCGCFITPPSGAAGNYLWSVSWGSQGFNLPTGADMTNTIIYNSSVTVNPNISTGAAPFTGTWGDEGESTPAYFDTEFAGTTLNGNWIVNIETPTLTGTVNSITLTFAA